MEIVKLSDLNILDIGNEIQLMGGIWTGHGKIYLAVFPGEHVENKKIVHLPMDNTDWEKFLKQGDLKEVEIVQRGPGGITKAILRKSQRQVDTSTQWAVFKRDSYACRYCGRDNVPLSVDHIDLWEEGGVTAEENLLSACKSCNRTRGKTPYEEWIKSEEYTRINRDLTNEQKSANLKIIERLSHLKTLRVRHIRSR